jgi:hypothetical protein
MLEAIHARKPRPALKARNHQEVVVDAPVTGAVAAPMLEAVAEPSAWIIFEVCAFWLTTTATVARVMSKPKPARITPPFMCAPFQFKR